MKAIHETGFKGYVAQEFIQNLNKLESLKRQLQVIFNDYKK
jgi:hydroxypyruvate isomerase